MARFKFGVTINPDGERITATLGVSAVATLKQNDVGKPVKLGSVDNYVVCAAGDEIEGFLIAVSDGPTWNDGFNLGTIDTETRVVAQVDAAQVGTLVPRELVVAGASAAVGTADAYPKVKQGTPVDFKWRVISVLTGTGVAGDLVLIEKIS